MASETLPPVTTDQLEALGEEPQSEADFPARILRPTDALQWLREEAKNLPSDFDREKVAEPFRELSPIEGRIRTEPAAQRLKGFLGLRALGPASRASLGTTLAAEIELPRIPAL